MIETNSSDTSSADSAASNYQEPVAKDVTNEPKESNREQTPKEKNRTVRDRLETNLKAQPDVIKRKAERGMDTEPKKAIRPILQRQRMSRLHRHPLKQAATRR